MYKSSAQHVGNDSTKNPRGLGGANTNQEPITTDVAVRVAVPIDVVAHREIDLDGQ